MPVADAFTIAGGGVVATGRIASGSVAVGDSICIVSDALGARQSEVTGMEIFRKVVSSAKAGDQVGIMLAGVEPDDLGPGTELRGNCN